MTMRILVERPPIYDQIAAVFDLEAHKPIFAWGSIIFNPWNADLAKTPQLIAHEEMHGMRQGVGDAKIRLWWKDYLESPSFRLEEEIPAHRAEYRTLLRMHGNNRTNRRIWLTHTAKRMCNPLYKYNHLFNFAQAKRFIELDEYEFGR